MPRSNQKQEYQKMFNVIVYDNTDIYLRSPDYERPPAWMLKMSGAEPKSNTWWWELGGILQTARGLADAVGNADNWEDALQFVIDAVNEEQEKMDEEVKAGIVQFWGHGSPGCALMAKKELNIDSFEKPSNNPDANDPNSGLYKKLLAFTDILSPGESSVWFRCCNAFHGTKGKEFAIKVRDFFNAKVIAHTYKIFALQSGTYILEPGEEPQWSDEEGGGWSEFFAPHTILATRFYPPENW